MSTTSEKETDWHSSKKIRKRARHILENPDEQIPSDLTFLVGSGEDEPKKTFKCHRFILALVSSVFQAQFYGKLPYSDAVTGLPDVTPAAFQIMLNFAYTDYAKGFTMENVVDTLYCAKKYMISKLARACRDFIQEEILAGKGLEHLWSVFEQARLIGEDNLATIALAEICRRTEDALEQPDFVSISLPSLKAVLECDNLSAPEPTIYQAVVRWAKDRATNVTGSLRITLDPLLSCIRFPLFTPPQIANGPGEDNIFTDSEEKNLYRYLFGDKKPDVPFNTIPRTPSPASWMCYIDLFVGDGKSLGRIEIKVRPDMAPACCQYLKDVIDGGSQLHFYGDDVCNKESKKVLPVPASVAEESNSLAHSTWGAVWFEWNEPLGYLYLIAWTKPLLARSAVFGHVCSVYGRKEMDSFWTLCHDCGLNGHVKFSLG